MNLVLLITTESSELGWIKDQKYSVLAGTCLGGDTPVMIGGVLRRRLQGPEESLSVINTCRQIMRKHC